MTIDSTSLVASATPYVGTVTFGTGIGGPTAVLTVNLTVTSAPQLEWTNNFGATLSGVTFTGVVNSDVVTCSNPPSSTSRSPYRRAEAPSSPRLSR